MFEKTPEYHKQRAKEREETRRILPTDKQLEYLEERPERKVGVPAKEVLRLKKSQEAQDQLLIETIRQRVKKSLNKDIKEQDIERLEKLEELAEKEKQELIVDLQTSVLYERGMADNDSDARRGTAESLGSLAEKDPENFIHLYEKGMADNNSDVRRGTAKSLGSLPGTRNFKQENKIKTILKDKYKISETELVYSYETIFNLLKDKKDLGDFVLKYLPEFKSIKEFSKEINSELAEDKRIENIEEFWQKNQPGLASLQSFDLNLSTQLIRQNLRLFGFPRLERFLNTSSSVLSNPETRDNLKQITGQLKDIDPESFSRLVNLADAFNRMNLKQDFKKETEEILSKKQTTSKETVQQLGKKLLSKFAEKLDIKTKTIESDINKWNFEYLAKLFEAEKQFKEEDKEFLKLIMKTEFQEKKFKEVLLGNYQGEYNEDEQDWLEQIEKYTNRVKKEFEEKGIDFDKWFDYDKIKEFGIGPSLELRTEKKESFSKELQETVVNLLGSYREKKQGLLSQDKAKKVFKTVFKKYGIQFRQGEFYHPQKGKLDLGDIDPVLRDFNKFIEEIYEQEKNEEIKEQIGTNLSHLQDLKTRLPELSKRLAKRGYHLSIKPWERNPGYDIFQGNYTHCCIAVESFNRGAILDYLSDAGMQIVEIRDETEDRTIAQTYVYFAEDSQGKVSLVLDNVEVNSDYSGLANDIRDNLFDYLKEYSLDVCPKTKSILLGTAYNDVETSDLNDRNLTLRKIGGSPRGTEYLDAFGSAWVDPDKETNKTLHLIAEDFKKEKTLKKKESSDRYITQTIEELDENVLNQISEVEQASFPEEMRSDLEDLRETLENEKGIQLITKNQENEIVSYLSSKPLENAYEELKDYDPDLELEKDVLYVESIATKPENRDIRVFLRTLNTIKEKAKEKGYRKIATHARSRNNLSGLLQKRGAKKLRTIEDWHNFGERFDYLEIEI